MKLIWLCAFILITLVSANTFEMDYNSLKFAQKQNVLSQHENSLDKNGLTGDSKTTNAADVYVDEDTYVLGSGDVLTAYLWGLKEEVLTLSVTNNSKVIIPTVGSVDVNRISLKDAKIKIEKAIKRKYKVSTLDIVISEVKRLKIQVLGFISEEKSVFYVSGASKLSTFINEIDLLEGASLRDVKIVNDKYGSRSYDLIALKTGIGDQIDPYLNSGDRVYIQPRREFVDISGAVVSPNKIDYLKGDNVAFLIELAGGFARGADPNRVVITRFADNQDSLITFEPTEKELSSFLLERDDRIYVGYKPDYRKHRSVTITGEVNYPGVYAIRDDKTKLVEIIGKAGGLTEKAYLGGSKIVRSQFVDAGKSEHERLSSTNYSELSPEEKNYLKYRSTTTSSVVSIDFNKLRKGTAVTSSEELDVIYDMILRDGDKIHIAQRGLSVNVMGAVVIPGLVKYKQGANIDYYIKLAGGFTSSAKKRQIKVIKGGTEIWLKPKDIESIDVGDAIWIPEKEYVDGMKRVRDIFTVVGGISSIIFASIAVLEYRKD